MHVLHLAQSDNLQDQLVQTPSFIDVSLKISYKFSVSAKALKLEVFGGIKNMFNSYQSDFDSGKNRDSNYIYGPSLPRAIYVGLKLIDF
jgi:outer membrane receptor for ferrienterochelin and colicins